MITHTHTHTCTHTVNDRCASQALYDKEVFALKTIGVDFKQHFCVPEGFELDDPRTWVFTHEDDNHKNKCLMNRVRHVYLLIKFSRNIRTVSHML